MLLQRQKLRHSEYSIKFDLTEHQFIFNLVQLLIWPNERPDLQEKQFLFRGGNRYVGLWLHHKALCACAALPTPQRQRAQMVQHQTTKRTGFVYPPWCHNWKTLSAATTSHFFSRHWHHCTCTKNKQQQSLQCVHTALVIWFSILFLSTASDCRRKFEEASENKNPGGRRLHNQVGS